MHLYRTHILRSAMLVCALAALVAPALGQFGAGRGVATTGGHSVLKGRVFEPGGQPASHVKVVLFYERAGDEITIYSDSSGFFLFDGLASGTYDIVVDAGADFEKAQQVVELDDNYRAGSTVMVPIYLEPKRHATTAHPGVVSARPYAKGIPENARKTYEEAAAAAQRDDSKNAIDLYKRAIAEYPKFTEAYNDLGLEYLHLGKVDDAIGVFREAVKIDPQSPQSLLNLGAALLEKRNFEEARTMLTSASALDAASAPSRLYLGISLIGLHDLVGAETQLQSAVRIGSADVTIAHYYLGGIYMAWHENERAATELETYLKEEPHPKNAERVRQTIAELRATH